MDGTARCAGARRFAFEYSATFRQAVAKGMTVAAAEEDIQKKRAKMLFNTTSLRSLDDGQKAQLALTAEDKRRAHHCHARDLRQAHPVRLLVQVLLRGQLR